MAQHSVKKQSDNIVEMNTIFNAHLFWYERKKTGRTLVQSVCIILTSQLPNCHIDARGLQHYLRLTQILHSAISNKNCYTHWLCGLGGTIKSGDKIMELGWYSNAITKEKENTCGTSLPDERTDFPLAKRSSLSMPVTLYKAFLTHLYSPVICVKIQHKLH